MAKPKRAGRAGKNESSATVGYEAQLWQMADALRGSMDAAEYKHVVLGLIFLKYISDAFEEQHAKLVAEKSKGADPEDPDEYRALSIFWVPPEARWAHLKGQARQATIGQLVDDAMTGRILRIAGSDSAWSDSTTSTLSSPSASDVKPPRRTALSPVGHRAPCVSTCCAADTLNERRLRERGMNEVEQAVDLLARPLTALPLRGVGGSHESRQ